MIEGLRTLGLTAEREGDWIITSLPSDTPPGTAAAEFRMMIECSLRGGYRYRLKAFEGRVGVSVRWTGERDDKFTLDLSRYYEGDGGMKANLNERPRQPRVGRRTPIYP